MSTNTNTPQLKQLYTIKKAIKMFHLDEGYLFEYLRRQNIIKPSTNKFSTNGESMGFLNIDIKGVSNRNKVFNRECYLTYEGLRYIDSIALYRNFKKINVKNNIQKEKNKSKCREYLKRDSIPFNENDDMLLLDELDYFYKNFMGYKKRYSMNEVCLVFDLTHKELKLLFARFNWIRPDNFTFQYPAVYLGLNNTSKANYQEEDRDNLFKNSYATFYGLLNISMLLRLGKKAPF